MDRYYATAASRMAGMMKGLPNFWVQVPFPIIASTMAMLMGIADDVGLGDAIEAAANIKDSGGGGAPKVGPLLYKLNARLTHNYSSA